MARQKAVRHAPIYGSVHERLHVPRDHTHLYLLRQPYGCLPSDPVQTYAGRVIGSGSQEACEAQAYARQMCTMTVAVVPVEWYHEHSSPPRSPIRRCLYSGSIISDEVVPWRTVPGTRAGW